jgi:nucleoside-diphosphate-sugar epimerase
MQALEHDRQVALTFLDALAGSQKPFIYTSGGALVSDHAVGEGSDRIVTEDTAFEPSPVFAPRAAAEREVVTTASRGIRTVVLRLASVYGRGGSAFIPMMLQFTRQAGVAQYIGAGQNVWPHVHVDDVAACVVLALERAPAGSLFSVASQEMSMKDLATVIARSAGLPGKTQRITLEKAMTLWGPFAGPMAANDRLSSQKAQDLLGWKPTAPSLIDELEHGSYADKTNKKEVA